MAKLTLLIIPLSLFAQIGRINTEVISNELELYYNIKLTQVYMSSLTGRISFSKKWSLKTGGTLLAKNNPGKICKLKIIQLGEKEGKVDIKNCPQIKVNQRLSLPPLLVKLDTNFREDSISNQQKLSIGNLPSYNENWYLYTSLGIAPTQYAPSINQAIQSFTKKDSMNNLGISLEALGVYFPFGKTLVGGVLGFVFENYKTQSQFHESPVTIINQWASLSFYQYSVTASLISFFGKNIGDGFFLRGDLGASSFSGTLDLSYTTNGSKLTGENQEFSYNWGPSILFGAGYAWPFSLSTRLMFSLYYSAKSSLNNNQSLTINKMLICGIGFLF